MVDTRGQRILSYETYNRSNFSTRANKTTRYFSETISFLGPKIWEVLPQNTKESENVVYVKLTFHKKILCDLFHFFSFSLFKYIVLLVLFCPMYTNFATDF